MLFRSVTQSRYASSIGADITTSDTQTYTGAVTLTGAATLTTTDSNISFGSTIGNSSAQNLTFNTGTGTVSVTGAVGSGTALGNNRSMRSAIY